MAALFNMIPTSLWVTLLVLLGYPIGKIIYNIYFHPLSHIPGPPTWAATRLPFVWSLLRGTIVHDFEKLHRQYGPVVRTAPDEVSFSHGDAWNDIYANRPEHRQFLKDPLWWKKPPGKPNSLLSAIGVSQHASMRKMLSPAFSKRALRAQEPLLQKYVNLLVERVREHTVDATGSELGEALVIDIAPWLNYTTFDIFGELGFGESFNCLQHSRYHPWIKMIFDSVKAAAFISAARYYPLVEFLLMKCIPASLQKKALSHFQQIVDKVDRRLSWELQQPDIMSHLIDEKGQLMWSRGELDATFSILTTAGSETTATVLTGIFNYLLHNPDKMKLVTDEIRQTFESLDSITIDKTPDLLYLNAVINEGLRLCPPVPWMLPRKVPGRGETVCGTWIPGGTSVSLQAYSLSRDPERFYNATQFLPERWLPDASTNPKSPFFHDDRRAVQPFSMGPRSCLGQHLAWAEMQLVLAKLLLGLDFVAVGKRLVWEDLRTFLLVEKKPLEVRVKLAGTS